MTQDEIRRLIESSADLNSFLTEFYRRTGIPRVSGDNTENALKEAYRVTIASRIPTNNNNKNSTAFDTVSTRFSELIKSQEGTDSLYYSIPGLNEYNVQISEVGKEFMDKLKDGFNATSFADFFKSFLGDTVLGLADYVTKQFILDLKQSNLLMEQMNTKTSMLGKFSEDYREDLMDTKPELALIGIGLEDVADSSINLLTQTGKFRTLSTETWTEIGKLSKTFVNNMNDVVNDFVAFEKVGFGINATMEAIENAGRESLKVGIQARDTTSKLNQYIGKLNEYTFRNSIEGLNRMIIKSTELRFNLDQVFSSIDKFSSLDKSIEAVANLQAMGGAIGELANPLQMMNLAINDVEGFQNVIVKTGRDLVTFIRETQRFGIEGINVQIAKERANAIGMTYSEYANMIIADSQRMQASMDLSGMMNFMPKDGENLKKFNEFKELITNMATMENGELSINIPKNVQEQIGENFKNGKVTLKTLSSSENLVKKLMEYQSELRDKTKEEIIEGQASDIKNINRGMTFIVANEIRRGGKKVRELSDYIGINDLLKSGVAGSKNFVKMSKESKDGLMTDTVIKAFNSLKETIGFKNEEIKKNNTEKSEKTKNEKTTEENKPKELKVTVVHTSNTPVTDAVTRAFIQRPDSMSEIIKNSSILINNPTTSGQYS